MADYLELSDEEFMDKSPALESEFEATLNQEPEHEEPEVVDAPEEEPEHQDEQPAEDLSGSEYEQAEDDVEHEPDTDDEPATSEANSGSWDTLSAPFQANGKEISARTPEEAKQLMQMGANYTQKMQELAPHRQVLKTLEKNGLLDSDKLNYLIDLNNKDPKAISNLLKESDIDPMDIDVEGVEYTPTDHQVSEQVIQVEEVIDSISNTPTGPRCMDVVGNQWDRSSQSELANNPSLMVSLNEQMSNGIFDKIIAEVERAKMFGGLQGITDFDAYRQVGAALHAKGELVPTQPAPVATTEVKQPDLKRALKKKAASIPRQRKTAVKAPQKSYLDMSDAAFEKLGNIEL